MDIRNLGAIGIGQGRADVRAAISRAAERTGVDFGYLLAQAKSESGLNPSARAGNSSATGLYQFIDQSWLGIVKMHGAKHGLGWAADSIQRGPGGWTVAPQARAAVFALREQPDASALMAAEYASDNLEGLSRSLGREPTSTDLYFAHFLGLDGAARFLSTADASPDASAAEFFPREARANRGIFYTREGAPRSFSEIYALMGDKLGDQVPATASASSMASAPPADLPPSPGGYGVQLNYAAAVFAADDASNVTSGDIMLGGLTSFDPLRPNPAQARLAYLMLGGDDEMVTSGIRQA